jgi:putative transposase
VLQEPRFQDAAPAEVYAQLLDEGRYLCSKRPLYRVLAENHQVRERRNQLRHPNHPVPQLHATKSNELWSWDITKLHGPAKWTYFHLYVVLDVFSRYVVGWMVAHRESATLAQKLLAQTCERQGIVPGQLTIHADRGTSMTSKPVALLMADLGVTKTHSRPHVSNDNPFSEAHFKTLKYRPDFPQRFGCLQDARGFCGDFFDGYNDEHHHGGLGLLTPDDVHHSLSAERIAARTAVLTASYAAHPERFPRGAPKPQALLNAVWINAPPALRLSGRRAVLSRTHCLIHVDRFRPGRQRPRDGRQDTRRLAALPAHTSGALAAAGDRGSADPAIAGAVPSPGPGAALRAERGAAQAEEPLRGVRPGTAP